MAKQHEKHCITLYLRDPDDMQTFTEARRLFPFYLNKSLSQFCLEVVRDKVEKLKKGKNL